MKKFKNCILVIAFILADFMIYGVPRGNQDLILPGHWVYTAIERLELEMVRTTFSDQAPVTISELKTYLDDIDYELLSDAGKNQYDLVTDYIKEKNWSINAGIFSLGVEPVVNVEGYYKTNEDVPWLYDYTKRQSLLEAPVKIGVGDFLSLFMGLELSQNYTARERHDNYCNQVFGIDYFDPALVHETYLSAGYCWDNNVGVNLRFGTGTQSLGNSLMPSIIMSEYLTDAPFINFRIYSPIFNYNLNITQLTRMTYLYSHRIEARLFKKIELSFIEGVLPYSSFDLRFINPFAIFHGYGLFNEYSGNCSSFFGIKASVTPCKFLRIYFLYAQNEHTLGSEKKNGDNSTPEGSGFQTGIESYIPVEKGYFHIGTEFYYANPYMCIKESPNVSFAKVFNEMVYGQSSYYQWMGSPLGPDSIALQFAFGYEVPGKWSCDLAYNFQAKGEFSGKNIFKKAKWNTDFDYLKDEWVYTDNDKYSNGVDFSAPHGTVEYVNSIKVKGTLKPYEWLTFTVQPGYTFINNAGNVSGNFKHGAEIIVGTKIGLTKISRKELSSDFMFKDGKEK